MITVADHIKSLPRFAPAVSPKNSSLPAINLSSNENPETIFHEIIAHSLLSHQDLNRYPDPNCTEIRALLAKDVNGSAENVIVGNGSEGILSYLFKAYCAPGMEILTANGTFVGVYILAQSFNIKCVKTPLTAHFEFDLDVIFNAINDRTSVIYLSNPNNPTGCLIPARQLKDFLAKVPSHILVILDEAYYEYARLLSADYDDFDYLAYTNLITLRTFSKAYGLANIRFGYGFAHKEIVDTLLKVKLTFEPSGIAQRIALVAKKNAFLIEQSVHATIGKLPDFYRFFSALNILYVRSYANFVMISLPSLDLTKKIHSDLIERNIRVSMLTPFGLPKCLRITVGNQDENRAFFNAFESVYVASKKAYDESLLLETSK